MKFLQVSSAVLALSGSSQVASTAECREKETQCQTKVEVNVTSIVLGLADNTPPEVFEAFVEASAQCLQCVDESDMKLRNTVDQGCNAGLLCRGCGLAWETLISCAQCCEGPRCMGCEWNYGPSLWWQVQRACDAGCVDPRRQLGEGDGEASSDKAVSFKIDVCMDDVSPLDSSVTYYTDYATMLEDFQEELTACYAEKDAFYDSWSTLCADSGIDLSLSTRSTDRETVMYGLDDMDTQNAVVTSYSSDESHRSTSHMIFYAALGFVTVSAFAVFGTALVVRALNKKKEGEEAQAAQWVSELTSVETTNPASPGPV